MPLSLHSASRGRRSPLPSRPPPESNFEDLLRPQSSTSIGWPGASPAAWRRRRPRPGRIDQAFSPHPRAARDRAAAALACPRALQPVRRLGPQRARSPIVELVTGAKMKTTPSMPCPRRKDGPEENAERTGQRGAHPARPRPAQSRAACGGRDARRRGVQPRRARNDAGDAARHAQVAPAPGAPAVAGAAADGTFFPSASV